jgi:nucleoside-triphosphatase
VAVTTNFLVTGPPRSGKTTVIQRTRDRLESRGFRAGGLYCPELRSDGDRVGFEIVDVMTGESRILAHVDRAEGPRVGKYRVNVDGVDEISAAALGCTVEEVDFLIVDEIAPMELYSDEFIRQVRRVLDTDVPLVAAIHYRSTDGFIGGVKTRDDTALFEVSETTRDDLPETLAARVCDLL